MASEQSVKIARLAVQTNIFPLYEVEDGLNYTLNYSGNHQSGEYLQAQSRFKHLNETDISRIQKMVDADWKLLCRKAGKQEKEQGV